jgi:hypothetical protein
VLGHELRRRAHRLDTAHAKGLRDVDLEHFDDALQVLSMPAPRRSRRRGSWEPGELLRVTV